MNAIKPKRRRAAETRAASNHHRTRKAGFILVGLALTGVITSLVLNRRPPIQAHVRLAGPPAVETVEGRISPDGGKPAAAVPDTQLSAKVFADAQRLLASKTVKGGQAPQEQAESVRETPGCARKAEFQKLPDEDRFTSGKFSGQVGIKIGATGASLTGWSGNGKSVAAPAGLQTTRQPWHWDLRLVGLERGSERLSVPEGVLSGGTDRVEVRRTGVTEWFTDHARGIEHGMTLEERPLNTSADGRLQLLMSINSELRATRTGRDQIAWQDAEGTTQLKYDSLMVVDARGKQLPAELEVLGGDLLSIRVTDEGAQYPVIVDPVLSAELVNVNTYGNSSSITQMSELNGVLYFYAYDGQSSRLWRSDGTQTGTTVVFNSIRDVYCVARVGNYICFGGYDQSQPQTGSELWRTADGVTYELVKDILPGGGGSTPQYPNVLGSNLYFTAYDGSSYELWKTDGTGAGTVKLSNTGGNLAGSTVSQLTAAGSYVLFRAYTSNQGYELWRTDGTQAGTGMLADIYFGSSSSYPDQLTAIGNVVYFIATEPSSGSELWRSDGTPSGTYPVRDLNPGPSSSNPYYLTVLNGALYFRAYDGQQYRLWRSDGTYAGTVVASSAMVNVYELARIGNQIVFNGYNLNSSVGQELWSYDGANVNILKDIAIPNGWSSNPNGFNVANNQLFFQASDGINPYTLWKSDGTAAGTIQLGTATLQSASQFTGAGAYVYFQGYSVAGGSEPWRTDGTAAGTFQLRDVYAGTSGSSPGPWKAVGSGIFFLADDFVHGRELWTSDGTQAGTALVKDIYNGDQSSSPTIFELNGLAYFRAYDGQQYRLWRSDGTAGGTTVAFPSMISVYSAAKVGNSIVFTGYDQNQSQYGAELWVTSNGTSYQLVRDIYPGNNWSQPQYFNAVGNTLFFSANDGTGYDLWKTDGTAVGTVKLTSTGGSFAYWSVSQVTAAGAYFYFQAYSSTSGYELWRTDGTAAGTFQLKDIYPGGNGSSPSQLTAVGSTLYFVATDDTTGTELWKNDGTPAGTARVKDIYSGVFSSSPWNLTEFNGVLYFRASDAQGTRLWRSDGTPGGTVPVSASLVNVYSIAKVGNSLVFSGYDLNQQTVGMELWRTSDGTTIELVKDIYSSQYGSSNPDTFAPAGNGLYFRAFDGSTTELWKTDGTSAGTRKVSSTGGTLQYFAQFVSQGDYVYFIGYTPNGGSELWRTDGTAGGTVMVRDIYPGSNSSNLGQLTAAGGNLFFSATEPTTGQEFYYVVETANQAPTGSDDQYEVTEDTTLVSGNSVLANDSDTDGGRTLDTDGDGVADYLDSQPYDPAVSGNVGLNGLVAYLEPDSGPAHGTLTLAKNGTFTYVPVLNYNGPDSFQYRASDGIVSSAPITVKINVRAVNDAPAANSQSVAAVEDTAKAIALAGSDVDGDALNYSIVLGPFNGTLSGTAPNLTYTPAPNYYGYDFFTFKVNDGALDSPTATVQINVAAVNDAPTANAQTVAAVEDTAKGITLAGSDVDGNFITYQVVSGPAHGVLTGTAPYLTYTPGANYNGPDSFTFKVNDGALDSAVATVLISVAAVNDPPIADAQVIAATEDTAAGITLTGSDVDGETLSYEVVSGPVHGTLSGTAPNLTYTPAANYNGADSFTFRANDGTAYSAVATVQIAIAGVNDAPTASAQIVAATEDVAKAITLDGNDVDGDALTYEIVSNPAHGTLSGTAPNLTYNPAANYNGSDSFTFKVKDGTLESAGATVQITVAAVNDAPVAEGQSITTSEDTAEAITLSGSDIDGDTLTYHVVSSPQHGTLSGDAPNLTYTPAANYNGTDSFTFKVNDGTVDSPAATVQIAITAVNDPPIAYGQTVSATEDTAQSITLSASDAEGDPLTYTVTGGPAHGTLSGTTPNLTYTPEANYNGSDSFTFEVSDGSLNSATATVVINIAAVNDEPQAQAQSVATAEDTQQTITLSGNDVDGDALTYHVVSGPTHGTLSGLGANLTYSPAANYNGPDSFTFNVNDGTADSVSATVQITIAAVNDAPTAAGQTVEAIEDTALNITLRADEVDGDALNYAVVSGPAHGTLGGTAPNLTYVPASNYNGPDSFTFKANDGLVESSVATVQISVTAVNDIPTANPQTVSSVEDTPRAITLSGSDVDGDALTYHVVSGPTHGTLSGLGANLTYSPGANYNGLDSFTFQANDGVTDSAIVTVQINVAAVNDAPTAETQTVAAVEDTATAITLSGNDVDGDTLSYQVLSNPTHGTLSGIAPNLTYTPVPNYNGTDSFTFRVSDGILNSGTASVQISVAGVNDAPTANAQTVAAIEDTASTITLSGSDVDGDTLSYQVVSNPGHGTLSGTAPNLTYTPALNYNGADSFTFKVSDGSLSSVAATVQINIAPANDAPTVKFTLPTDAIVAPVNAAISFGAQISDPDAGDSHKARLTFAAPGSDPIVFPPLEQDGLAVADGAFAATLSIPDPGVYSVTISVRDQNGAGAEGTDRLAYYVVIYDPTGGFVTGGGWINSPLGAYAPNPSLTGKANFGFVSKYKKGAPVPEGNTEFQFKTGNLNFQSVAYQWLVVSGARAQFKGTGTINGSGNYGFLLTAIDGDVSGGGKVDKFRIKIWQTVNGVDVVIYDNQMGASDSADPTTALGGGSVVIQK